MQLFQTLNLHSSNLVKNKLLLLFILDSMNQLWLEKKKLKMFNSTLKEQMHQRMQLEEVVDKILMMKKDKNKLKKELIEIFLLGPKLVNNSQINHLILKSQKEIQDSMVQPTDQMFYFSPQKPASLTLPNLISLSFAQMMLKLFGLRE